LHLLLYCISLSIAPYISLSSQDYEKALKYIRTLLKNEPGNKQALELEKLIDKALKKGEWQRTGCIYEGWNAIVLI
jgi:uncharacterized protein HemY